MRYLRYLPISVPAAFLVEFLLHNALLSFILSAIGLIALSALLGEAIEALADHTGPQVSAVLNATLGTPPN